jgi:hypothetical protein
MEVLSFEISSPTQPTVKNHQLRITAMEQLIAQFREELEQHT